MAVNGSVFFLLIEFSHKLIQKSSPWSQGRKTPFGRKERTTYSIVINASAEAGSRHVLIGSSLAVNIKKSFDWLLAVAAESGGGGEGGDKPINWRKKRTYVVAVDFELRCSVLASCFRLRYTKRKRKWYLQKIQQYNGGFLPDTMYVCMYGHHL